MIAVIGPENASKDQMRTARWVGRLLASAGVVLVTGGGGGVMEAASRGAATHGGLTVEILPGADSAASPPNEYVQIPIFTGLGDARNAIVARAGEAVIAIGGAYGTLSEIGLALAASRPVVLLDSWQLTPAEPIPGMEENLHLAKNPREAVNLAIAYARTQEPGSISTQETMWTGSD